MNIVPRGIEPHHKWSKATQPLASTAPGTETDQTGFEPASLGLEVRGDLPLPHWPMVVAGIEPATVTMPSDRKSDRACQQP